MRIRHVFSGEEFDAQLIWAFTQCCDGEPVVAVAGLGIIVPLGFKVTYVTASEFEALPKVWRQRVFDDGIPRNAPPLTPSVVANS
ncbi:hypothetical protein [uncultured Thiodictyon sp.]|uniref:hypothetical protein n=1 Tax=uncultured Thiodictyon sp. TaxID=1846217 RepID=UPI0025D3C2AA|nr:hypothetical protein [uncultured Thiodictyon sp.]